METFILQSAFALDATVFLSLILMHLAKKRPSLIRLYALQSVAVSVLLFGIGSSRHEPGLMFVALVTLLIKAVVAPLFFQRILKRFDSEKSANTYLNTPMTLLAIIAILLFANSAIFKPFAALSPDIPSYLSMNWAMLFVAMLMMFNRRGAFGQIIAILSFENGVVLLAALLHIAQPVALEVGIVFDLVVWIIIAEVFMQMVFKQFGTLNITGMRTLTED
jgi:hydrogenase-4 component E